MAYFVASNWCFNTVHGEQLLRYYHSDIYWLTKSIYIDWSLASDTILAVLWLGAFFHEVLFFSMFTWQAIAVKAQSKMTVSLLEC